MNSFNSFHFHIRPIINNLALGRHNWSRRRGAAVSQWFPFPFDL